MGSFGWSFSELSRESGVSVWTYRRLADKGLIRTINIGARRLIPAEEIERIKREGVGNPRGAKVSKTAKFTRSRRVRVAQ